jgi:hypothetical protein
MSAASEARFTRIAGDDGNGGGPAAGNGGAPGDAGAGEIALAALRGVIGAAAMSGMRELTVSLGIVDEPPPRAIARQQTKGLFHVVSRRRRRIGVELMHWFYGGVAGIVFGLMPEGLRRRAWFGPAYGVALWVGFDRVQAPLMGLKQAEAGPAERIALIADHLLYGFVLSEMRRRPQG